MSDTIQSLFGSEELTAEQQVFKNKLAAEGSKIRSLTEPAFDTEVDPETAEVMALQLVKQKDASEAQLSFVLYTLKENSYYMNEGYEKFADYVERKLKFSSAKASNLAKRWAAFIELGLSATVLSENGGIAWNKFGELMPGVNAGVISADNIDEWLPLTANAGDHVLPCVGIQKLVRAEIANTKAEEDPDQLEKLTFSLTADDKAWILRDIQVLEEATGITVGAEIIRMALESKITELATDSADVRTMLGLVRLKEIAESIAPGIRVLYAVAPDCDLDEATLGIQPVSRIYQDVNDPGNMTVAYDADTAAEILGSDDLYEAEIRLPSVAKDITLSEEDAEDEWVEEEEEEEELGTTTLDLDDLSFDELRLHFRTLAAALMDHEVLSETEVEEFVDIELNNPASPQYNYMNMCEEYQRLLEENNISI